MKNRYLKVWIMSILVLLGGVPGFLNFSHSRSSLSPQEIPSPLKPWVPWVLKDHEDLACPFIYNDIKQRVCAWPSRLKLTFTKQGGKFSQEWEVMQETVVTLPGESKFWPQDVTRQGRSVLISDQRGRPAATLQPGHHTIQGAWTWTRIPESILLPKETGLISLTLNGTPVLFPQIDEQGRLWIRSQETVIQEKTEDSIEVHIYRKLIDDIPFQVATQFHLVVSGQSREIVFPDMVDSGFEPLVVNSPLPAQIDTAGQLRLQVKAGDWRIGVTTRSLAPIHSLTLAERGPPWPTEETWVIDAKPELRVIEMGGGVSVDPQQTLLPDQWKTFPAFIMKHGETMTFTEQRRGNEQPGQDHIKLTREFWLDFDGTGYTVRDRFHGNLIQTWRLTAQAPMRLGRVLLNQNPHLITRLPDSEKEGVEVRRGSLGMMVESRMPAASSTLSAVGWDTDTNFLSTTLYLPPGWRLFHTLGVDHASPTWIAQWSLLDMFLVLITSVAIGRLWSWPWGLVAGVTFALSYHEYDAPRWIWGHILIAVALLRVLPGGGWKTLVQTYRIVSLLVLLAITLPFMVQQVRLSLYSQLDGPWHGGTSVSETQVAPVSPEVLEGIAENAEEKPRVSRLMNKRKSSVSDTSDSFSIKQLASPYYAPSVAIQTGPGIPSWQGRQVSLEWSGPVSKDQQVTLWYLSPALLGLLLWIQVIGLGLLIWRMFDNFPRWPTWKTNLSPTVPTSSTASLVLLLWIGIWGWPAVSQADMPSPTLLEELENRLLEPPSCLPACADIPSMHVRAESNTLRLRARVHIHERVAIPLPGPTHRWRPQTILVDGHPAKGLALRESGYLWLHLRPGLHQVIIEGAVPNQSSFVLSLPLVPHFVETSIQEWTLEGIDHEGVPKAQWHFHRQKSTHQPQSSPSKTWQALSLPPLVRITRTIHVGMDWTMETVVERLSPKGAPFSLSIPLLSGERILKDHMTVKDGVIHVPLGPQSDQRTWASQLTPSERISLTASENHAWVETYRWDVNPLWHPTYEGIPAIHQDSWTESNIPEWQPWPGETLTVRLVQPLGVEGQTFTAESSHLTWNPGQRATDATLKVAFRSSQGHQHQVGVPEGAIVNTVQINGHAHPIHQEGQLLTLSLRPGKQNMEINWRAPIAISTHLQTAAVNLGVESVNARVTVKVPPNRWVLWVNGPRVGPAVLIWGVLVVILGVAMALGRMSFLPLRTWQWMLLGLGLSQVPIEAALIVVGWFGAMAWRQTISPQVLSHYRFNFTQLGLVLLSVATGFSMIWAIQTGLMGIPQMSITGNGSTWRSLEWFQDRTGPDLPQATILSLPLGVYRVGMLLWALWLAFAAMKWIRWGWNCWTTGGYWQPLRAKKVQPEGSS